MKKITILALLPFLLQSSAYAESQYKDLNVLLIPEFEAARTVMKSSTPLELESMIDASRLFAKKGAKDLRQAGINNLVLFQEAIKKIQDQQYKTSWDNMYYWMGIHPNLVKKETKPALSAITNALISLGTTQSEIVIGTTIAITVAVGVLSLLYWMPEILDATLPASLYQLMDNIPGERTYENIAQHWALIAAENACKKNKQPIASDYFTTAEINAYNCAKDRFNEYIEGGSIDTYNTFSNKDAVLQAAKDTVLPT